MQVILAHELTHDKHHNHGPEFHKLMYDYICKIYPDRTKWLYVWAPNDTRHPYSPWSDMPDMITESELNEMRKSIGWEEKPKEGQ